ncbi:uncharacterized protein YndB with AHSA1/START domain [Sphingomonas sp. UYAg733]
MTKHKAVPSRIEIERQYDASPERVFSAWASPEALLGWGTPGEGWEIKIEAFSFEPGGEQITRFGPGNGEVYLNRSRYHDILPGFRIVSSGSMCRGSEPLFAGVLTVELEPVGEGCLLRLTELGVFLDGRDLPENHQDGWRSMLDRLARQLAATPTLAQA